MTKSSAGANNVQSNQTTAMRSDTVVEATRMANVHKSSSRTGNSSAIKFGTANFEFDDIFNFKDAGGTSGEPQKKPGQAYVQPKPWKDYFSAGIRERDNIQVASQMLFKHKARSAGFPDALKIFNPNYDGEKEPFPIPRIYEFESLPHLAKCIRDVVLNHKQMWMDGWLHRDVNLHTIRLGSVDAALGHAGGLRKSTESIHIATNSNHPFPYAPDPHPDSKHHSFKSIMELIRLVEPSKRWPEHDHLDDLESILYIIAWIAGYMDGPKRPLFAADVLQWKTQDAFNSIFEKKDFLSQPTRSHVTPYFWNPAFWNMFAQLCKLCRQLIDDKVAMIEKVVNREMDDFPKLPEIRQAVGGRDHDAFLAVIELGISEMESPLAIRVF